MYYQDRNKIFSCTGRGATTEFSGIPNKLTGACHGVALPAKYFAFCFDTPPPSATKPPATTTTTTTSTTDIDTTNTITLTSAADYVLWSPGCSVDLVPKAWSPYFSESDPLKLACPEYKMEKFDSIQVEPFEGAMPFTQIGAGPVVYIESKDLVVVCCNTHYVSPANQRVIFILTG